MKAGKEPMRTFGDLMQFFEEKHVPGDKKPVAESKGSSRAAAVPVAAAAAKPGDPPSAVDPPPAPQAESPATAEQAASPSEPIAAQPPQVAEGENQQIRE